MTTSSTTTVQSCEGRLNLDGETSALVYSLGEAWGTTLREIYTRCVVGQEPWFVPGYRNGVRSQLIERGWSQREATSMLRSAQAAHLAAQTATKLQIIDLGDRIEDLNQTLKKIALTIKSGLRKSPTPKQ